MPPSLRFPISPGGCTTLIGNNVEYYDKDRNILQGLVWVENPTHSKGR